MIAPPAILPGLPPASRAPAAARPAAVEAAAREFEAVFLAEMLAHSGFAEALTRDSGFAGESMGSFLVEELGRQLAARGSFGIAELLQSRLGAPR